MLRAVAIRNDSNFFAVKDRRPYDAEQYPISWAMPVRLSVGIEVYGGELVRPRGFEPLVGRPAGFIDAGVTSRWQERSAGHDERAMAARVRKAANSSQLFRDEVCQR